MYELLWCLTFLINNFMLHLPSNRYLVVGLQGICAAQLAGWHPRLNALLCWTVSSTATADLFFSLNRQVEDEAAAGLLVVSPVCGEKLCVRGWALPGLEAIVDQFTPPEVTHPLGSGSPQPFVQEVLEMGTSKAQFICPVLQISERKINQAPLHWLTLRRSPMITRGALLQQKVHLWSAQSHHGFTRWPKQMVSSWPSPKWTLATLGSLNSTVQSLI